MVMNNFFSEPLCSDATVSLSIVRPLWFPLFSTLPKRSRSPIIPPKFSSHLSAFLQPSALLMTSKIYGLEAECAFCHVIEKNMSRCGDCSVITYCSTDCQRQHWSSHKFVSLYLFISPSRLMTPLLETTALAANHLMITPRVLASHSMYLPCATASILGER